MTRFNVVTTFEELAHAEDAISHLHEQGFGRDHVGLLTAERGLAVLEHARSLPDVALEEDPEKGVATGGLAGALLGGLTGLALAGPPGLMVGGVLLAVSSGLLAGGAIGSLIGLLGGMGIPERQAIELDKHLREGALLLTVHTVEPNRAAIAEHTLRGHSDAPVGTFEVLEGEPDSSDVPTSPS